MEPPTSVPDYGNVIVTAKELGNIIGLSEFQISILKRRGIFQSVKAKKSEFQLGPNVRAYIQYKSSQDSEANADFHRERALKERANRQLREILVEQTRGQLHHADDVRAIVGQNFAQVRSQLLAFGNLLTLQVAGKDPVQIKTIIDTAVRKVLLELREYNPRTYYRRSKVALSLIKELDEEQSEEKAESGNS
jgi:hypothetical protein